MFPLVQSSFQRSTLPEYLALDDQSSVVLPMSPPVVQYVHDIEQGHKIRVVLPLLCCLSKSDSQLYHATNHAPTFIVAEIDKETLISDKLSL